MLGSLILVFALCTDTFVASLAYGANRVHVGWGKVALLNGICSGCLGLALGLGSVISSVLPGDVTRLLCKPVSAGIHQIPGLQHQGLYQPPLLYPP